MTLNDFFENYYLPLRLRSRSKDTIRLYRYSIKAYSEHLGRCATFADLDDLLISRHLSALRARELSPYSVEKERAQLLAIWNFAARKGYVEKFPDVPREPLPDRVPEAWTLPQAMLLLAACRRMPGNIGSVPASSWWTALHLVCWDTAERIGAMIGCEWAHVRPDGWLIVPAENRKGKTRDRIYRLSEDTMAELDSIRLPRRKLIFPWPYSSTYLWTRYKKVLKQAGLPHNKRCMFHRMRRTVASHYKQLGGDATELLDHQHRKTTEAYLDPTICKLQMPSDLLPRIGKKDAG